MRRGTCSYCGRPAAALAEDALTWWHDDDSDTYTYCNTFAARFVEGVQGS